MDILIDLQATDRLTQKTVQWIALREDEENTIDRVLYRDNDQLKQTLTSSEIDRLTRTHDEAKDLVQDAISNHPNLPNFFKEYFLLREYTTEESRVTKLPTFLEEITGFLYKATALDTTESSNLRRNALKSIKIYIENAVTSTEIIDSLGSNNDQLKANKDWEARWLNKWVTERKSSKPQRDLEQLVKQKKKQNTEDKLANTLNQRLENLKAYDDVQHTQSLNDLYTSVIHSELIFPLELDVNKRLNMYESGLMVAQMWEMMNYVEKFGDVNHIFTALEKDSQVIKENNNSEVTLSDRFANIIQKTWQLPGDERLKTFITYSNAVSLSINDIDIHYKSKEPAYEKLKILKAMLNQPKYIAKSNTKRGEVRQQFNLLEDDLAHLVNSGIIPQSD